MQTIYRERANGRWEFWTYSDGQRVMLWELWARNQITSGKAKLVCVS